MIGFVFLIGFLSGLLLGYVTCLWVSDLRECYRRRKEQYKALEEDIDA